MARRHRVHYPGAIYHTIARGNNQEAIFLADSDKRRYLDKVEFYQRKFDFQLLAYVLMTNHLHLLIRVEEDPLSKIMQGIQVSYTKYFNKVYDRSGHVFTQRYKAYLCDNDAYLVTLIKYIHLNPVRAGMDDGIDYPWSSHKYYTGEAKGSLVTTELVYELIDQGSGDPVQSYQQYLAQDLSGLEIAGLKEYCGYEVSKNLELSSNEMQELLAKIAQGHGVRIGELFSKPSGRKAAAARRELIYILANDYHLPQNSIASWLGVSNAYVCKILNS